ncbi:MAG: sensor histidine kinase KdpD [Pigmentiphaga sp.]|uniref:sensor histidine kinase KdpD n=1 Tax=Pigmentiphaga sp. TaxID=1977564 RepID=UPI0029A37E49|nr:sensor histidine kinase KdpD [Pigmentiphaga sp.]MDX3908077.1 sensor histidine kinase KdpD [Pigmentiphaga sp.]
MASAVPARPDPDTLLQQLDAAARPPARGRLRIYFGASAGVGKTYAMLEAARQQLRQGADVVAGIIETHGRKETQALLDGIPALPPAQVPYRDRTLKEFDLDGALARRPALVLVDELAHSNAPGSRHAKRWQDVQELLAAGIEVWTTLNVQHLDSLNEAVGGITGVRIRETVPDDVFDAADEVILVDTSADELLRRLKQGKVYLPDQAQQAAGNFFRKGNLIALRELALRRTAEHVDDDVQAYRLDRAITDIWRTREAVLACVAADDAGHVVRNAHRLAQQLDCELHVVTIETLRVHPTSAARQDHLRRVLAHAETLGARTEIVAGTDMVEAVVRYVRRHNITKVVIGRTMPGGLRGLRLSLSSLLSRLLAPGWIWHRHSFADLLAAGCPEIDVIRVAAPPLPSPMAAALAGRTGQEPASSRRFKDYAWALVYCGVAAGVSSLAFPLLHQTNIVMLFLLAVIGVALRHGRGPAALASLVSVGLFDFLFVQPRWSFAVSDIQYVLTFLVLLAVGLVIGQLTAGLRLQAETSVRREGEARGLYEFARELSSALQPEQIVEATAAYVRAAFDTSCVLYVLDAEDRLFPVTQGNPVPGLEPALAQWAYDHEQAAGAGTATVSTSPFYYLPLRASMRTRGVLAIACAGRPELSDPESRRQMAAYGTLIGIALERLHYVEVAQHALLNVEAEKLRNSLLAAVSHDLRTPLTSLVGTAETLARHRPELPAAVREQLHGLTVQARRMHAMVGNILDMARLQSGETPLHREWQSIEELVGSALASLREAFGRRRVIVERLSDLPLVECDGVLIERVLCNLLENAIKYTPETSTIQISAGVRGHDLVTMVTDDGPGVPPEAATRIFDKFTRGERESSTAGVGLGLAVCQAIIRAHRGDIRLETPPDGHGARFAFTLPLGTPPALQTEPDHPCSSIDPTS